MENVIVIIGGGLSGLYCAALLSKRGKKVTIVEQHATVGGLAAGFTRKGYYFDRLGIYEKLDFRTHIAVLNIESKIFKPKNVKEYFDICCELFPEYKEGLMKFYNDYVSDIYLFYTIERYTGNTGGSHCGFTWDMKKNKINSRLGKFHYRHENISNLYFIGHWTGYMGGVTNAFWSAKHLTEKIC